MKRASGHSCRSLGISSSSCSSVSVSASRATQRIPVATAEVKAAGPSRSRYATTTRGWSSSRLSSSFLRALASTSACVARDSLLGDRTYSTKASSTRTVEPLKLEGRCKCGQTGWVGDGASAINFSCHCSICRKASGEPYLTAAGFKPNQVKWINPDGMRKETPPGSKNGRYYCKGCGQYLGEDATRPLGIIALPLALSKHVHESYLPNHHLFYADRVQDVNDNVTKWKTIPQGEVMQQQQQQQKPASTTTTKTSTTATTATPSAATWNDRGGYDPKTGAYLKEVLPLSPTRAPDPLIYHFTETDPIPNHVTHVSPDKVQERVEKKYYPSPGAFVAPANKKRDVIIIGGGHNGLTSAAYLAKHGLDVLVLERRHTVGGAAVSEEIVPGFKFSRASYLAGLLRPQVIKDLKLENYGFKYLTRDPSSFTPSLPDGPLGGKYLLLGSDERKNHASIAQFSKKDADAYPHYEEFLDGCREIIQPLLDGAPPNPFEGKINERVRTIKRLKELVTVGYKNKQALVPFYELFTGPASHILDRWFESEILKTTLATDAVIGAMCSPTQNGSAYVLLHHVMGEAAGKKGVWAYVQGGMGAISQAIASSAKNFGAEIATNATVKKILFTGTGKDAKATGVLMQDGTVLEAKKAIFSNANPYHTFLELMPGLARDSGESEADGEISPLPAEFQHHIRFTDYSCGSFKINCAIDSLPNFSCFPSPTEKDAEGHPIPGPMHRGTIHFENTMQEIENAYREASMGVPASRPVIEMTIPSALDRTVAPKGKHVCQLFVQFAPYGVDPKVGNWADPHFKNAFIERVFKVIDEYAPGFSRSIIGVDALSPLDLEKVFGLHKGNIFHGAMGLHQLGYTRPAFGYSSYRTPLSQLYLCGAGAHPGGGVMGAAGRNAAFTLLSDLNIA